MERETNYAVPDCGAESPAAATTRQLTRRELELRDAHYANVAHRARREMLTRGPRKPSGLPSAVAHTLVSIIELTVGDGRMVWPDPQQRALMADIDAVAAIDRAERLARDAGRS